MSTTTTSGLNAGGDSLKNHQIGSPADGRKLNGSGTVGSSLTSDMTVSSVVPVSVKDVDSKVIEGSHKSGSDDVSSKFSTESFKNQAGPRGETGNEGA